MNTRHVDFKYVREHADFEKVALHYGLALIGKGQQKQALCCFHDEDTPSLKINTEKNIFNCFGCGKHGNILDFVTLMEDGDPNTYADLRRGGFKLAEICGIDPSPSGRGSSSLKNREAPGEKAKKTVRTPKVKEENPIPTAVKPAKGNKPLTFTLKLDATHPYPAKRGLSLETIETFGLGVCARGMMKGRLAIPIHNEKGELIAYAGRWAEKDLPKGMPKYLLPEGFEKQSVLFNLNRIPKGTKKVVMVESYFSVFRLHELGTPVVSPMGHSLSETQCKLLVAYGVENIVVLFDGDTAGAQGIAESVPLLSRYFFVHAPAVREGFKPHKATEEELAELIGK